MEINTLRLFMRPIQMNDAAFVFGYRSDRLTNQFQGWIPEKLEDVHDFIKNKVCAIANRPETWMQLVAVLKESGTLIGDIGIHFIDDESKQVELGCTFDKKYHNLAYATEAISGVINYLFTELYKHRIIALIDPRNEPSIRLVRRIGFRQEAHFRESNYSNGEWTDDLVFAMLEKEWKNEVERD
jgi:RimJ/RimL family protein N-acetyltransferase